MAENKVFRFEPEAVKGNLTLEAVYGVCKDELEKVDSERNTIFRDLFINTADLKGIQKFEAFYDIKPNAFQTLEERRAIVLNKTNYRPPFTRQRLTEILESIWGKGKFVYTIYPDEFKIMIDINTNNPIIYLQFSKQVRNIIPANLFLVLNIQYTYMYLKRHYTYRALSSLDYKELQRYRSLNSI